MAQEHRRKLPEKCETGKDVVALSIWRGQQAALLGGSPDRSSIKYW